MENEEGIKKSNTNDTHEAKLMDENHLEKLDAPTQGNAPAQLSPLECKKMIDELAGIVYYKSKALIECQKLTEYGTELIKKKNGMQMRLSKAIEKQMQFGKYDNLITANAKKHELEQQLNPLTYAIKHCGERIRALQIQCEKEYPKEKIERILVNIRSMKDAGVAMDFSSQINVNSGPSNIKKLNEEIEQEKPNLKQLEDLLREAKKRQGRTFFLHRSIEEIDSYYARRALELMLNNKRLLQICLLGLEMIRELLMSDSDTDNPADCKKSNAKKDGEEHIEDMKCEVKFDGFMRKTDDME
ncbi:unnamed protein product [Cercopithifilaria johnstoni]|uniref:Uncharacterized protein n=1 Tax=Cercopithifilaria johnstoni TaxID=2874296 RepID=A0A8J2MBB1_9BILA|nr:unnamed protein product [Cercopithifilaria johnstoni]